MAFALPLEVEENIIDHLHDHTSTLLDCSMVCKSWIPRARFHLFRSISIRYKDELDEICNFLDANPSLRSLVRTVTLSGIDFCQPELFEVAPIVLLPKLPHVHQWEFVPSRQRHSRGHMPVLFRSMALHCFSAYLSLRKLRLATITFLRCAELGRLLLACTSLDELECVDMGLQRNEPDVCPMLKRRLMSRLHISRLSVSAAVASIPSHDSHLGFCC